MSFDIPVTNFITSTQQRALLVFSWIRANEKSVKTRQPTLFSLIDLVKGEWLSYELVRGMKPL